MRKFLRFFILFAFVLSYGAGYGQSESPQELGHRIHGTVKDKSGQPMVGVSVVVIEAGRGTSTDLEGNFAIWALPGSTLLFSYLGYDPIEKTVSASATSINVTIGLSDVNIGETVITGYRTASVREITGSVGMIKGDELRDVPMQSVDMLLQGKLAGVSVQSTSGQPGSVARIRIRGENSITGNGEPLWVVDGIPLQKDVPRIATGNIKAGDFSSLFTSGVGGINPNDIESITVLKDAASAAIYGSQAANGVIVVTTKKGAPGKMKVNYSGNVSVLFKPQRNPNLMNSREKLAWEQELWDEFSSGNYAHNLAEYEIQRQNPTYTPNIKNVPIVGAVGMIRAGKGNYAGLTADQQNAEIARLGSQSTDWFDVLLRNSVSHSHDVSFSGGTNQATYYISMGYQRDNGLVVNTNSDRYSFRTNLNMQPTERLSWNVMADLSILQGSAPSSSENIFQYAYFANPYESLYNADGSYRSDETYLSMVSLNGGIGNQLPANGFNIMREMNETVSKANSTGMNLSTNLRYDIIQGLAVSGVGSFSYNSDVSTVNIGAGTYTAFKDRPFEKSVTSQRTYGSNTIDKGSTQSYMLRAQLDYNKKFSPKHRIALIGGTEIRSSQYEGSTMKRYGYDELTGLHQTPAFPQSGSNGISYEDYLSYKKILDDCLLETVTLQTFASFYGEADYFYKDLYGVTFTARADGSNNFGSRQQFNTLWSAGVFWNIDREKFMEGLTDVVNHLSIKVSTGITGNVNRTVSPVLIMSYGGFRESDYDIFRMARIGNPPNPLLRWEKKKDKKVSLNAGFINRIKFGVEYYHNKGVDLVTKEEVPYTTGYNQQSYNTSEQINQGVEFYISTANIVRTNFRWTTSFNVSWNRNILTKFQPYSLSMTGNRVVNYPQNSIFGQKPAGINADDGLYDFVERPDSDGTSSYTNYIFYLGVSMAPWNGGFHTSATYRNFTLSIGSSFSLGAKISSEIAPPNTSDSILKTADTRNRFYIQQYYMDLYTHHFNTTRDATNRWTADNPITTGRPRIIDKYAEDYDLRRRNSNNRGITLQDVSYFKINSIVLTYSIPETASRKIGLDNAALSFMVNNIFMFTNYTGLDPESPGTTYPQTRSASVGVTIGF